MLRIVDFSSNRLAFVLLSTLLVLIVLSAFIPQRNISQDQILDWKETLGSGYTVIEKLGLDRIYFSPFFFVVLGLLGVNLAVANVRRFRIVYRAHGTLLRARHIGSIVFHLALLLIMAAVILNYLYKFHGVFGLTEGQTGQDAPGGYFRQFSGPLCGGDSQRFQVTLQELDTRFQVGEATTNAAVLRVLPAGRNAPLEAPVRINQPLVWSGFEFHLGAKTGFSPEVMLMDSDGEVRFRSFVRLAAQQIEGKEIHADYVPLGERDLNLRIEVQESPEGDVKRLVTGTRGGTVLFDGIVAPGDTVLLSDWKLAIPRLRRWCFIEVVRSPYLNLVFTGFWLALGGLIVGFVPRVLDRRNRLS